jgi:hypothetical protein
MSGMMSDMKTATFTVRDLNRHLGKVLETCDRFGAVRIRSRAGKTYALRVESGEAKAAAVPDFAARRRAAGMKTMGPVASEALDRAIAGE